MTRKSNAKRPGKGTAEKHRINQIVSSAIRECINDHPGCVDPGHFESLVKRVSGQIWNHFYNNLKLEKDDA